MKYKYLGVTITIVLEVLKYPLNIALLTLHLAVLAELPQRKLYCNCCLVNVSQFLLYGLEACPLRKADFNVLDFVINRFFIKLFRTNDIRTVKDCQLHFSFQLPREMLKNGLKNSI